MYCIVLCHLFWMVPQKPSYGSAIHICWKPLSAVILQSCIHTVYTHTQFIQWQGCTLLNEVYVTQDSQGWRLRGSRMTILSGENPELCSGVQKLWRVLGRIKHLRVNYNAAAAVQCRAEPMHSSWCITLFTFFKPTLLKWHFIKLHWPPHGTRQWIALYCFGKKYGT